MAIVSNLPFTLDFIKDYEIPIPEHCSLFFDDINEALRSSTPTIAIQENDPITIRFNGEAGTRLYLDALDIIPSEYGCLLDEQGRIFYEASEEPLPLYRIEGNEFDELRVDNFLIEVKHGSTSYFGWLQVQPKQLQQSEWEIMISDLENVATGLSQDIVQRNIGFGDLSSLAIPPKQLRQFLIFQKRAPKFLSALYDIAENPRFSIRTEYVQVERSRDVAMDLRSIRHELQKPNYSHLVLAPQKSICYDTQENRQLKRIINYCIERIKEFHSTVNKLVLNADELDRSPYSSSSQYRIIYRRNLKQYQETSNRLIKMVSIISNKEWYKEVSDISDGRSSHAFALDPCFAYIDRVYRELKSDNFTFEIDPAYSYSWKKSSHLYEVWCYLEICRFLGQKYQYDVDALIKQSGNNSLFPVLETGKQLEFWGEECRLIVSYDRRLPSSANDCTMNADPYFYDTSDHDRVVHNRPDIRIDIFHAKKNLYVGSIIIECKYRKIRNFYRNGTYNSKEQLTAYFDDAQTRLYFGKMSIHHNIRPVLKVFAVTPDDAPTPRGMRSGNVVVRKMRPGCDDSLSIISNEIFEIIQKQIDLASEE